MRRRRRSRILAVLVAALAALSAAPARATVLFPADARVPRAVQQFAWKVIETRCNFQPHELAQRSFWAHHARTSQVGDTVVYAIDILSDLEWKRSDLPVTLAMVVVDDGRGLRVTGLESTFISCAP